MIIHYQLKIFINLFDINNDNYISEFIKYVISKMTDENTKNIFYKYLINYDNVFLFDIDDKLLKNIDKYIFLYIPEYN
jgi:hypothetical protein